MVSRKVHLSCLTVYIRYSAVYSCTFNTTSAVQQQQCSQYYRRHMPPTLQHLQQLMVPWDLRACSSSKQSKLSLKLWRTTTTINLHLSNLPCYIQLQNIRNNKNTQKAAEYVQLGGCVWHIRSTYVTIRAVTIHDAHTPVRVASAREGDRMHACTTVPTTHTT